MREFLTTAAIMVALAAPAYAADNTAAMSGPAQTSNTGMSGGMAHDGMAMGKKKPKKPMHHDSMSGGSMAGPSQTGGGMSGGMQGGTKP